MTEQLSRRQVEWLRDAATEFASTQMKMTMKPEEVLQLTTALLAGMDSKPVAKVETVGVCWYADNGVPRKPAVGAALYAAVPAPVMPSELHPDTQKLVADFCAALAEKLYKAQLKYGYDADWKQDGWPSQCQAHFHQHIAKGDPRDVAAYCAFMWYHGWKTEPAPVAMPDELTREEYKRRFMEEDNFDDTYRGGWNAFRAAMLKAGPETAATVPDDTKRLDWLDAQNKRLNEYYGTSYGWKFDANFQRNAMMLNDSNYPVMTVRQAIDEAMLAAAPAAPEQEV